MKNALKIFSVQNRKLLNQETLDKVLSIYGKDLLEKTYTEVPSPYNSDSACAIRPTVVSAIGILSDNITIGLKSQSEIQNNANEFNICIEYHDFNSTLLSVVGQSGIKCCRVIKSSEGNKYAEYRIDYDGGAFLVASYMMYIFISKGTRFNKEYHDSFRHSVDNVLCSFTNNSAVVTKDDFALISEVVYRELALERKLQLLKDDEIIPLTKRDLKRGAVNVDKLIRGRFSEYLTEESIVFQKETTTNAASLSDYTTEPLSPQEQKMVPTIPEWYVEPAELSELVELICCSTKTTKPKRNFMFRGPSSTGKTSLARALAAKLNKPYVYLTCSSDTESYDFLGQPMYDSEGKIRFIESNFISAIKNGWVVEIQEPYVIAKQGVLTALNGLLDDSNGITLSTGEYVERHPDTVVVLTTNVDYVGCRQPNQSVLRRMNGIYDIEMPTAIEIKKRVKSVTKFNNDSLLDEIVDVFFKINEALSAEDCTDGVCTVTELIDWVSTIMITKSVTESALSTIISKATHDKDMQLSISNLISAKFDGEEYE